MSRLAIFFLIAGIFGLPPAQAGADPKCSARVFVLWGDGKHDDTAALNAWFRGERVIWGQSGRAIGSQISDHDFRLTAPIYIPSGTGRRIDHFRFFWPQREEIVAGGAIAAGPDPNRPPVATGIAKIGADPSEGVPFPTATPHPSAAETLGNCLVS